jgi:hypothetical protein
MTFRGKTGLSVQRRSAAEPALKFEVLSVGFQDLDRQTDMVFFFFSPVRRGPVRQVSGPQPTDGQGFFFFFLPFSGGLPRVCFFFFSAFSGGLP